jgi:hypothetical protein
MEAETKVCSFCSVNSCLLLIRSQAKLKKMMGEEEEEEEEEQSTGDSAGVKRLLFECVSESMNSI